MFDLSKNIESKPVMKTRKVRADKITPIRILEEMNAVALLETAYSETGKGKFSILILKEAFTVFKKDDGYFLLNPNGKKYSFKGVNNGFLGLLKEFRDRAPNDERLYEFPIPFGGVGFLGYEFFEEIEKIDFKNKSDDRNIYDSAFIFGRNFLIFDHLHDEVLIVSAFYSGEIEDVNLDKELENVEDNLKKLSENFIPDTLSNKKNATIVSNPDDKEKYMEKVRYIKNEIHKGNLLQCVLSRRIEIETDILPIEGYRNLRIKNPSPYMFFLNFKSFFLYGASPEVMVKIKGERVIVRPIAGTRKRGETMVEDLNLERELKLDIKENAEHLMLVDLGRNDIGKVSIGGTVKLTEEKVIERYSNVMHLVSEVEGVLDKKLYDNNDVINATFPAGTVSGAPKIQAIKTIDMLEDYRRGPYAGLVGYFERENEFDSCITIRSAIQIGNKIWLQSGAGIVYDSVPELEYEETVNKMMALLLSLGLSNSEQNNFVTKGAEK